MIDYREIIRLHSLKFSNVAIANSLCCSRNTVSEVLKLAETHSLEWPIPETLTNRDIGHLFYPGRGNNEGRRLPDYEYVYNELAKPGVTLSLLWAGINRRGLTIENMHPFLLRKDLPESLYLCLNLVYNLLWHRNHIESRFLSAPHISFVSLISIE